MAGGGRKISRQGIIFCLFFAACFCGFIGHTHDETGDLILKYVQQKDEQLTPEAQHLSAQDQEHFDRFFQTIVARSLYERKTTVSAKVLEHHEKIYFGRGVFRVYGTSFGVPGNKGESAVFKDGTKVRRGVLTAALPDNSAVGRTIQVRRTLPNGKKSPWVTILVRDLGPWFRDDPYWQNKASPRAVQYFKQKKKRWDGRIVTNPAGIDLTPWVWQKLGVPEKQSYQYSGYVEWRFKH